MHTRLFALLLSLLFLHLTHALQAQLLWKVSGKGLEKPSYLYGTVHVGDERAYQFHPNVLPAFEEAEGMAGELVFEPAMLFQLMGKIVMKDTTLADLLPKEKYELVHAKLNEKLGFMAPMAERIQPVFVSSLMLEPELGTDTASRAPSREPLDLYFQNEARKADKEVVGLETVQEQLDAFGVISLREQAEMLYQTVAEAEKQDSTQAESSVDKMLDLYAAEDIEALYKMTQQEMDTESAERLLTARNRRMVERFIKLTEQKSWFVAVGAAHLPGEHGLIALLREAGYTVAPHSGGEEE